MHYKTTHTETIPGIIHAPILNGWFVSRNDQEQHYPRQLRFEIIGQMRAVLISSCKIDLLFNKDWLKFQLLVEKWHAERGASSSITQGVLSPSYQSIIGMGEAAIPLIISQLRMEGDDPDQWFWALQAITMKNPVSPEEQGDFRKMAQSWIRWAEDEGYAG